MIRAALIFAVAASVWLATAGLSGQQPLRPKMAVAELGPATFKATGINGGTVTLSAADVYQLPQQTVNTTDHGTAVTFQGVLLSDVLSKVATPVGEAFNKAVASCYVVVEAADGYKAVFSWAEIDPAFTDRKLYLVTKRDGRPISSKDGPFELIVPGEKRNSRWVRQVAALNIRQAN